MPSKCNEAIGPMFLCWHFEDTAPTSSKSDMMDNAPEPKVHTNWGQGQVYYDGRVSFWHEIYLIACFFKYSFCRMSCWVLDKWVCPFDKEALMHTYLAKRQRLCWSIDSFINLDQDLSETVENCGKVYANVWVWKSLNWMEISGSSVILNIWQTMPEFGGL